VAGWQAGNCRELDVHNYPQGLPVDQQDNRPVLFSLIQLIKKEKILATQREFGYVEVWLNSSPLIFLFFLTRIILSTRILD